MNNRIDPHASFLGVSAIVFRCLDHVFEEDYGLDPFPRLGDLSESNLASHSEGLRAENRSNPPLGCNQF